MIRPSAVLFDCDGVLVDSEGLVNRILAEELTGRGWAISAPFSRTSSARRWSARAPIPLC